MRYMLLTKLWATNGIAPTTSMKPHLLSGLQRINQRDLGDLWPTNTNEKQKECTYYVKSQGRKVTDL